MGWSVGKQSLLYVRRSGGERGSDGRPAEVSNAAATVFLGTVNPVPGDVLLTLPEGERTGKQLRLLTEIELQTTDDILDTLGDYVVVRGEVFEVRDVAIYQRVIPHFEYRIRRIRPPFVLSWPFSSAFSSAFSRPL